MIPGLAGTADHLFSHCIAFGDVSCDYGILSLILLSSSALNSTRCAYFLCLHCFQFFSSVNALPICKSKSLEARDHICAVTFLQYLI